jgi:hypothetical protein
MAFDSVCQVMVLFGGDTTTGETGDTWIYSGPAVTGSGN